MTLHIYVYYKVAPGNEALVRTRVEEMQKQIAAATGTQGSLLRRRDDPSTWMEVYADVEEAADFESVLSDAVTRHQIATLADPALPRITEIFRPF